MNDAQPKGDGMPHSVGTQYGSSGRVGEHYAAVQLRIVLDVLDAALRATDGDRARELLLIDLGLELVDRLHLVRERA